MGSHSRTLFVDTPSLPPAFPPSFYVLQNGVLPLLFLWDMSPPTHRAYASHSLLPNQRCFTTLQSSSHTLTRVNVFSIAKVGRQGEGCTKDRWTETRDRHFQMGLGAMCSVIETMEYVTSSYPSCCKLMRPFMLDRLLKFLHQLILAPSWHADPRSWAMVAQWRWRRDK